MLDISNPRQSGGPPLTNPHRRFFPPSHPGPRLNHLAAGTIVRVDGGFHCAPHAMTAVVKVDQSRVNPRLFITCNCGRHYLHEGPDGRVDGLIIINTSMANTFAKGAA